MTATLTSVTQVAYPNANFVIGNQRAVVADVVLADFDAGVALAPSDFGLAEIHGIFVIGADVNANDAGVNLGAFWDLSDSKLYPTGTPADGNGCAPKFRLLVLGL